MHERKNLLSVRPFVESYWITMGVGQELQDVPYDCSYRFECDKFGLDSTLSFSFISGPSASSRYPKHIIFCPSALRWSSDRVFENSVQAMQAAR